MGDPAGRESRLRSTPEQRLERLAANFARIASCVDANTSDAELSAILEETEILCEGSAIGHSAQTQLLRNLKTALGTWRQVWPRLGSQREFRLAVAREAALWSKRMRAMKDARAPDTESGRRP